MIITTQRTVCTSAHFFTRRLERTCTTVFEPCTKITYARNYHLWLLELSIFFLNHNWCKKKKRKRKKKISTFSFDFELSQSISEIEKRESRRGTKLRFLFPLVPGAGRKLIYSRSLRAKAANNFEQIIRAFLSSLKRLMNERTNVYRIAISIRPD